MTQVKLKENTKEIVAQKYIVIECLRVFSTTSFSNVKIIYKTYQESPYFQEPWLPVFGCLSHTLHVWPIAEITLIFCRGFLMIGLSCRPLPTLRSTEGTERVRANTALSSQAKYSGFRFGYGPRRWVLGQKCEDLLTFICTQLGRVYP